MPDLSRLDSYLADADVDGYLIDAAGDVADQRYLSGFNAPDPYFTLYTPDTLWLLVSGLEYNRARETSDADTVKRYADYDYMELREELGAGEARRELVASFLGEAGIGSISVPKRFPIDTADGLREREITVEPETDEVLSEIRATKTDTEIERIDETQTANEAAMAAAEELIAAASVDGDTLRLNGEPLTAERIKEEIEVTLLRHGCGLDETIVAGGQQGADPHERGHGPLPAHEPIVIDIFPKDKASKYHADMTRTFLRGEASEAIVERFDLTNEALQAALETIEPGVTGEAVHDAACAVYEEAGYPTLRSDPDTETGFIHSTGHGVGLEVHELPRLAPGGDELEPGHVVTVEPGLYHPDHGGIRTEDLVVVTDSGYRNLTEYHKDLIID
ncbi:MAG: Xaa-Pro peptidase family protein [Halobacteriales archaeon]|nr:Xaa-Pro peptidase family protein [Halobacteriales archaeon]